MGFGKRRVRELAAETFDLVIFPKSERDGWPEKDYAQRLFDKLGVDCVFDVGANRGQFGHWLRYVGFGGLIASFEPNPAPFEELKRAAEKDGNWLCRQQALGREKGNRPLNVMSLDVFSSFLKPVGAGDYAHENSIVSTVEAQIQTLDDAYREVIDRHSFNRPFLKMDTQGFDLEVVAGGAGVLRHFTGLLSEVAVQQLYEGSPRMDESIDAYRRVGFLPAGMFSVHPSHVTKLIEMNAYFVRDDLAEAEA